ncbi:HalOD1 output domain-containing protein [Saliphagus sp. LR7]|uniref:HalOD1 output domain-containing protein n=1 Tax=Saliphagus sp. LR7 TaxID=2282654 RepID=UPI000DF80941|nr:HalOD1 output domain-containing protein [Saliphagus sp. LR7]
MNDLDTVRTSFDPSTTPPSVALAEAIAAIENVPITDLNQQLHDYIDTEALDELMDRSKEASVRFSIDQYDVRVNGDSVAVTC